VFPLLFLIFSGSILRKLKNKILKKRVKVKFKGKEKTKKQVKSKEFFAKANAIFPLICFLIFLKSESFEN
jgi:hypothetical protein